MHTKVLAVLLQWIQLRTNIGQTIYVVCSWNLVTKAHQSWKLHDNYMLVMTFAMICLSQVVQWQKSLLCLFRMDLTTMDRTIIFWSQSKLHQTSRSLVRFTSCWINHFLLPLSKCMPIIDSMGQNMFKMNIDVSNSWIAHTHPYLMKLYSEIWL